MTTTFCSVITYVYAAAYFSFNEKLTSDITETLTERVLTCNTIKFYLNLSHTILCCKNGETTIIAIK